MNARAFRPNYFVKAAIRGSGGQGVEKWHFAVKDHGTAGRVEVLEIIAIYATAGFEAQTTPIADGSGIHSVHKVCKD